MTLPGMFCVSTECLAHRGLGSTGRERADRDTGSCRVSEVRSSRSRSGDEPTPCTSINAHLQSPPANGRIPPSLMRAH